MDSYQNQLDAYNAREDALVAKQWKQKKADRQRYENAAKEAHKIRMAWHLTLSWPVRPWDSLPISSQQHLIADAENVAKNPSITEPELRKLYIERLLSGGDTENQDLGVWDENGERIEGAVLEHLKSTLSK